MVRYSLEQRVFMYDTYEKFRRKLRNERVCSRQKIRNLVTLNRQETKRKRRALTEKLDDIRDQT
jgi:hypothetical protein